MKENLPSASLFDITTSLGNELPISLLQEWQRSDRTETKHTELLAPYKVIGTLVCSDSEGLSLLTQQHSLIEMLGLINEPKEIIAAYAKNLNGRFIGTWYADNTSTFYSENVNSDLLLESLIAAQNEIKKLKVQVGFCLHRAEFIFLQNGLYGPQADLCNEVAENHTKGGEIILTESVKKQIKYSENLILKSNLNFEHKFYQLNFNQCKSSLQKSTDSIYPFPFDLKFYNFLKNKNPEKNSHSKYLENKFIILIHSDFEFENLLLNQLQNVAKSHLKISKVAENFNVKCIKLSGSIAIYSTESFTESFDFSISLQKAFKNSELKASISLTYGEVIIFKISEFQNEIAGQPVNIAAKIAEDFGESGYLYIHESVELTSEIKSMASSFSKEISKVEIKGYRI